MRRDPQMQMTLIFFYDIPAQILHRNAQAMVCY